MGGYEVIEYAMISEIGEKQANEDTVKAFVNQPLSTYGFVLADGLGGHGNGDIASNFVVDCAGAMIENTDTFEGVFIDECFETAQEMLMEEKDLKGFNSIKTTMVMLLITGKQRSGAILVIQGYIISGMENSLAEQWTTAYRRCLY